MSQTIPVRAHIRVQAAERNSLQSTSIPWTIWCMLAGVISGAIGGPWDISWHMSIGRDTFWTPAHIAIQMTGVLVGIACAYMILTTTFARESSAQGSSVKMW